MRDRLRDHRQRGGLDLALGRIVAVFEEFSLDLIRSVRSAVPYALRARLGKEIEEERLLEVADAIFAEVAARYKVGAGATILAISARSHEVPTKRVSKRPARVSKPTNRVRKGSTDDRISVTGMAALLKRRFTPRSWLVSLRPRELAGVLACGALRLPLDYVDLNSLRRFR